MISIGMPGVILDTPLSYDGDRLVLTLPRRAALDGERLRRRLESLAQLLGRQAGFEPSSGVRRLERPRRARPAPQFLLKCAATGTTGPRPHGR